MIESARNPGSRNQGDEPPRRRMVAWTLGGICVAMFLASVVLLSLAHSAQGAHSAGGAATFRVVVINTPFLTFPLVGALIASRRPRNLICWICLAVRFLWGFTALSDGYITYGTAKPGSVPFVVMVAALTQWMWVLPVGLLSTYLLLLFPDGRLPSGRCVLWDGSLGR